MLRALKVHHQEVSCKDTVQIV